MLENTKDYRLFLNSIKKRIQETRVQASLAVNRELVQLYWSIGKEIVEKQNQDGWGANVIERLGKDLQNAFPGIKGFSTSNIFRMRKFFLFCQKVAPVGPLLREPAIPSELLDIPWRHNIVLIERLDSWENVIWYAQRTIENGWSRRALEDQIQSQLHVRQGKAVTNFEKQLPSPQSQLANEVLKDPYSFDFLTLTEGYQEKELEEGLIKHIQKFLLELGAGFAFIGRQYHLKVSQDDYYIDLLFYHTKLHCYCVVELKTSGFKPEYAGKLNFYLKAVDMLIKQAEDNPTIGILLCKTKDNLIVEYALSDINKPIGVAGYETKIVESLPDNLKGSLPTIEEIEEELASELPKEDIE